jgi:hypothetical protein
LRVLPLSDAAEGQYALTTSAHSSLSAHECTHVIQPSRYTAAVVHAHSFHRFEECVVYS